VWARLLSLRIGCTAGSNQLEDGDDRMADACTLDADAMARNTVATQANNARIHNTYTRTWIQPHIRGLLHHSGGIEELGITKHLQARHASAH
jgi:hypothetical protein